MHCRMLIKEASIERARYLVEKCSTSENHGELARVVCVVEPVLRLRVPRVEATRKTDQLIAVLAPDTKKHDSRLNKQHSNILYM